MLVGPILGSILFNIGGFQLPFYVVGILLLGLAVVNQFMVPADLGVSESTIQTEGQNTTVRLDRTEAEE